MFGMSVIAQTQDGVKPAAKTKAPVKTEKKAPPTLKAPVGKASAEKPGNVPATPPNGKKINEVKIPDLPNGISDYVKKNIPGGTIVRAGTIEEKGILTYVVMVKDNNGKHAYLFDKSGNFTGKGDHLLPNRGQGPRR